ncbi:MAG: hypothetical protein MK226_23860 [Saprospiraceae bacterium]|nr:hypothetical protein [Saprospiraceae bacterium]
METRRQKADTPMYTDFEQIINRDKDTEKASVIHQIDRSVDVPIDVDIIDDNGDSTSVSDENVLYSLDEIADALNCSTKTIYRSDAGYFSRIKECFYWEVDQFKDGDKYTSLALKRMEQLQASISNKNSNRITYDEFKTNVWLNHQNRDSENNHNNSSQLATVKQVDGSQATEALAIIFNAENEAAKFSVTANDFMEQFRKRGEQLGHQMAAEMAKPMVAAYNESMGKIMQKLGGFE